MYTNQNIHKPECWHKCTAYSLPVYRAALLFKLSKNALPPCLCVPAFILLSMCIYSVDAFILMRITKATRSQLKAHNLTKKQKLHAGTHYFCRYQAVNSVSGKEKAVEMRLKWISSEKASRRTQIQGCFWLVFLLLFWSGKKSSNSRGCPYSC